LGHRIQPVARSTDYLAIAEVAARLRVPLTLTSGQENIERPLHVHGKAVRTALVGFKPVAESGIGVPVSPNSGDSTYRIGVIEKHSG
jgi:hypothetical protein